MASRVKIWILNNFSDDGRQRRAICIRQGECVCFGFRWIRLPCFGRIDRNAIFRANILRDKFAFERGKKMLAFAQIIHSNICRLMIREWHHRLFILPIQLWSPRKSQNICMIARDVNELMTSLIIWAFKRHPNWKWWNGNQTTSNSITDWSMASPRKQSPLVNHKSVCFRIN